MGWEVGGYAGSEQKQQQQQQTNKHKKHQQFHSTIHDFL
jgi:hypothetical protein